MKFETEAPAACRERESSAGFSASAEQLSVLTRMLQGSLHDHRRHLTYRGVPGLASQSCTYFLLTLRNKPSTYTLESCTFHAPPSKFLPSFVQGEPPMTRDREGENNHGSGRGRAHVGPQPTPQLRNPYAPDPIPNLQTRASSPKAPTPSTIHLCSRTPNPKPRANRWHIWKVIGEEEGKEDTRHGEKNQEEEEERCVGPQLTYRSNPKPMPQIQYPVSKPEPQKPHTPHHTSLAPAPSPKPRANRWHIWEGTGRGGSHETWQEREEPQRKKREGTLYPVSKPEPQAQKPPQPAPYIFAALSQTPNPEQ